MGNPSDLETKQGAVVSKDHMEKVLSYIKLAQEEGGTILAGGHQVKLDAPYDNGFYIAPTIIEGLSYDCRTNQEEIFGPVLAATKFQDLDEVISLANDTQYGLGAGVFTSDVNKAHSVAAKIQSGNVWINHYGGMHSALPFGGYKHSGIGREAGKLGLEEFLEVKAVSGWND